MSFSPETKRITIRTFDELSDRLFKLCQEYRDSIRGVLIYSSIETLIHISLNSVPHCCIIHNHNKTMQIFAKQLEDIGFFARDVSHTVLIPERVIQWHAEQQQTKTARQKNTLMQLGKGFFIYLVAPLLIASSVYYLQSRQSISALESRIHILEHNNSMPTTQPTTASATKPTK